MSINDTWMPLYLGDYLADTMHLTTAQHGAYLLLLMHYWRNGPLVDDDSQLAAIARCDSRLWKTVGQVVRGFFRVEDGVLHQKRMDRERNKWSGISDKRRDAGRVGAEAKWRPNGGASPPNPSGNGMANAMNHPVDNSGNRIANAIELPLKTWQTDGKCQNFAIAPVPSKKNNILTFKDSSIPARAREAEPTEAAVRAARLAAAAEIAALPDALGSAIQRLGRSLGHVEYAPGRSSSLSREEQIAAMKPKGPTPYHLNPELLRSMPHRQRALAAAARR